MKKMFMTLAACTVFALSACGGGGGESGDSADNGNTENAGGSVDAEAARSAYDQNCLQCHGQNLEGKNGPALAGRDLSQDHVLSMIQNGGAGMPDGLVSGEKAENLAAWVANQ
ncbi:c-type cytochrome [Salibacterium halotolerans]|uniref:Cytochrome c551 n=1 Tax=Salibacterium halotolerans TaxID=1884432 RepID=A0A1I5VTG3_9BACI|nr:cytochrome c [Salibacterium halotolerans]SFQ10683.1 cytochrome c551 [Salibacterium halotolerans]